MITGMKITKDLSYVNPGKDTAVCIILEHTSDKDFLTQLANRLLDCPCRTFNFYGAHDGLGEVTFDRVDMERGYTDETVAVTACCPSLDNMALGIYISTKCEKKDTLVLYDDLHTYQQLLRITRKRFPWWLRRSVPKADKTV